MGSGRGSLSGCPRQGALPGLSHPEEEDKACLLSAWLSGGGGGSGAAPSPLAARAPPLDSATARPLFPASARAGRRARGRGRGQCEGRGARGAWWAVGSVRLGSGHIGFLPASSRWVCTFRAVRLSACGIRCHMMCWWWPLKEGSGSGQLIKAGKRSLPMKSDGASSLGY